MDDESREYDYGDDPYSDDEGRWSDGSDNEWKEDLGGAPQMQSEYKDRERAGGTSGCWLTGADGRPLKTQDPRGRFCLKVDAVSRNIRSTCNRVKISEDQIQLLLNKSQTIKRVEYKNPSAFVLGYLATDGGVRKITKTSLTNVWNCYSELINRDESIKPPDIIRYARWWVK